MNHVLKHVMRKLLFCWRCLRIGYKEDTNLIDAFLNTMANKLYPTDKEDQHTSLRQINAVLAIGHIACALKETESALTILQQRFCHPPSKLDNNIIEQFSSILLTSEVCIFSSTNYFKYNYFCYLICVVNINPVKWRSYDSHIFPGSAFLDLSPFIYFFAFWEICIYSLIFGFMGYLWCVLCRPFQT